MIKLVALDLDDTLLLPDGTISQVSKEALIRVRAQGVIVTLATGRMYRSAVQFAKELELDVPIITYQGALIKTSHTEEVWRSVELETNTTRSILQFLESEPVHINLYRGDDLYVKTANEVARQYASFVRVPLHEAGLLSKSHLHGTIKIVAIGDVGYIRDSLEPRAKELFGGELTINTSRPHFLEIGHREATKSNALAFLGERFDIRREEMLAMGDGVNDLDMLEYVGVGVAMGNADPRVLEVADYITDTNCNDGVAKALKIYVRYYSDIQKC